MILGNPLRLQLRIETLGLGFAQKGTYGKINKRKKEYTNQCDGLNGFYS